MAAATKFQEVLGIALLSGRGELLEAADLPASPEDVIALRNVAVDLINGAAVHHARRDLLHKASLEVLGAIRSGAATHLARLLVLCEPTMGIPSTDNDAFKERSQELKAALLDEAWPIEEERL